MDIKTVHEGCIYDVKLSQAHINEHPSMVLLPTIYNIDNGCTPEVPCVLITLATEDIPLTEDEMLGFLIENNIELDGITKGTVYDTPCQEEGHHVEIVAEKESNISMRRNFITSQQTLNT